MNEENEINKIETDLSLMDMIHNKKEDSKDTYVRPPENEIDSYYQYIIKDFMEVDFDSLLTKNKDTKGYIQIEGTTFSYPFVLEKEKNFYKTHSYYHRENKVGWLSIRNEKNLDTFDNIVFYADGERADRLFDLSFAFEKKWLKEDNLVRLSTEKTNSLWKPFSIYLAKDTTYHFENPFTLSKRSIFNFSTYLTKEDSILTILVRYKKKEIIVLHAKLIKKMRRE